MRRDEPKHPAARTVALLALAVLGFSAPAAPVTGEQARMAARNWLRAANPLATGLGRDVAGVQAENEAEAPYYVAALAAGGFVVLSSDDEIEPVLAFSDEGAFPSDAAAAVRELLARDMRGRARAAEAARAAPAAVRRAFSAGPGAGLSNPAKWARLLADPETQKTRSAGNGLTGVTDLRVAPLVKSQWGQERDSGYSNTGYACYNLYTPGNSPCGCVATALAQLIRHWEYPRAPRAATHRCRVDGAPLDLDILALDYDYASMPHDPSRGTTLREREAIGRLTSDCGIAMQSDYSAYGTSSFGAFAHLPLRQVFSYASAQAYCRALSLTDDAYGSLYANFDAGCPALLMLAGHYDSHAVLADGYGFVASTPYTHLNIGWTAIARCNLWYNLPNVATSFGGDSSYSVIDGMVYNIIPDETGDILSGRVRNADGTPAAGVTVTAAKAGGRTALAQTVTSATGVYAFVLPGGAKYDVQCGTAKKTGIDLRRSVSPDRASLADGSWVEGRMALGNSWGNDLVLTPGDAPAPGPGPGGDDPGPSSGLDYDFDCALGGLELMPGQNVSVPVEIACAGCTVRSLKARGLPAGLKLAKDRKTGAYAISGAPKRASAKPFDVQLTLQVKPENAAEKAPPRVKSYALSVLPLPDWSIGTFSGIVWVGDRRCTVTVKAKASGAVSGSVMDGRKKFPFASAYGRGASADGLTLKVEPKRLDGAIRLDVFKAGLGPADVGAMTNAANEAFLVQEPWKTKPFKGLLRKYASPDRTLRWTPAGTFTYAAPTGGRRPETCKGTLLPIAWDGDTVRLVGFALGATTATRLDIRIDATGAKEPEWTARPLASDE